MTAGCTEDEPTEPVAVDTPTAEPEKQVSTLDPDPSPAKLPTEADEYCENLASNNESDDDVLATFIERDSGIRGIEEGYIEEACSEYEDLVADAKDGFYDGNYSVGDNDGISPGRYLTIIRTGQEGIRDCYWERSDGHGDIIDNNFVSFASDGVTVTVQGGEDFSSDNCGAWKKIS